MTIEVWSDNTVVGYYVEEPIQLVGCTLDAPCYATDFVAALKAKMIPNIHNFMDLVEVEEKSKVLEETRRRTELEREKTERNVLMKELVRTMEAFHGNSKMRGS